MPKLAVVHESYADGFRAVLAVLTILVVVTAIVCFLTLRAPTARNARGD